MSTRDKKTRAPEIPDPLMEEWRPKEIGPYTILKVLGEGGMGTVYLAEQFTPIRRLVALKLIKLGHDTKEVLARFDQERQALSLMNHPNIAKVFDAGANTDGRPYFVMEFVDGVRISDYCDTSELSITDRLHLFLDVCTGIQHAHQKGIIHRDIKPSNILVTEEAGKPVPKIIDFGLAQATEQRLIEETLFTQQGQWIGTPEYMSPEQAGRGADVLDTRADIYSLGVLLYELLTGHLPFDTWLLREAGLAEIQRTIQEVEPPKPSTKVGTATELDVDLAKRRATEPTILRKKLRGDLDWIVMCAIEKEPTRRYASAGDFAADIQRHLDHKPANAGPPSFGYRAKKFLRRYRLQVGAAAAVLIALIAGLILAFSQYRRAEQNLVESQASEKHAKEQEKLARAQEQKAAKAATEAEKSAELAKQAQERFRRERDRAQEALDRFELLSLVAKFDRLLERADSLWPRWPSNREELRRWMTDFNGIYSERLKMTRAIDQIDKRIADFDAEFTKDLRDLATKYEDYSKLSPDGFMNLARSTVGAIRQTQQQAVLESVKQLRLDQFMRTTLTKLLESLRVASGREGIRAEMRQRIRWAIRIERRSITNQRTAWRRAARRVGANKVYRGFTLYPQVGLAPLGADPITGLEEFVHLASQSARAPIPQRGANGRLALGEGHGIIFVLVPPLVGSNQKLQPPIFLAKHEVTQSQWRHLSGGNPSVHAPGSAGEGGRAPTPQNAAENISHVEATRTLGQHGLRLPREPEWAHAARGTRSRPGPLGVALDPRQANVASAARSSDDWIATRPVGMDEPNAYGLHDLYGNVAEWCARTASDSSEAMIRGGCWNDEPWNARSDPKRLADVSRSSDRIGVRPARNLLRRETR